MLSRSAGLAVTVGWGVCLGSGSLLSLSVYFGVGVRLRLSVGLRVRVGVGLRLRVGVGVLELRVPREGAATEVRVRVLFVATGLLSNDRAHRPLLRQA